MTKESIYSLGLQLLDVFKLIHQTGHVYNDLKLDNILLGLNCDASYLKTTQENFFEDNNVNLIDFGFASKYLDESTLEHISKEHQDVFKGNILFATKN